MKICVLSFTGLDTDGRDATRILKEIRSLVMAGHEVKAIGLRLREDILQKEQYYGVEINRVKPALGFDRKLQREIPKLSLFGNIKRLYTLVIKNTIASGIALFRAAWTENADVYHCFGIYSLVPGFFLKILKRKKIIYDSYEPVTSIVPRIKALGPFSGPISRIIGFLEIIMVSTIDYVLTISSANDFVANRFEKHCKNVLVLENVPERDFVSRSANQEAKDNTESAGVKKLFYMGALTRDKGIIKMVDVLQVVKKQFGDVRLVLAGSFKEANVYDNPELEVKELIEKYSLQENVIFLGFVARNEISKHLQSVDVALHFYQPISWFMESKASSSFFEYMSASLPIVASDFAGFKSIIEENRCGITVDPTNTEEIAEKVIYLIGNPSTCREMGENGRRAFENKYNWGVEEVKLLRAYSELEERSKK